MQKEAAKKYCGMPFQKYEGLRAAVVKAQYQVEIIHTFNRRDFSPAPNVDTVLLHFKRKSNTLNQSDYKNYKDLVAYIYIIKAKAIGYKIDLVFYFQMHR